MYILCMILILINKVYWSVQSSHQTRVLVNQQITLVVGKVCNCSHDWDFSLSLCGENLPFHSQRTCAALLYISLLLTRKAAEQTIQVAGDLKCQDAHVTYIVIEETTRSQ